MLLFAKKEAESLKEVWFIIGFAMTLVTVITIDKVLEKKGRC